MLSRCTVSLVQIGVRSSEGRWGLVGGKEGCSWKVDGGGRVGTRGVLSGADRLIDAMGLWSTHVQFAGTARVKQRALCSS